MKRKIVLTFWVLASIFLADHIYAQIYENSACFYAKAGESSCSYVVRFEGSLGRLWLKSVNNSTVRSDLNKNKNFYENETWTDGKNNVYLYEYDSSKSNYKYVVYKRKRTATRERLNRWGTAYDPYTGMHLGYDTYQTGWDYVAVPRDKSCMIKWYENLDNYSGEVKGKTEYSRIPKEDLLPKSVNYDFLQ